MTQLSQIGRDRLLQQLHALGVEPGGVLVVHASFRAIAPVEGGVHGLIDALGESVGSGGTLVMPSMTDREDDQVFEPRRTPCLGMGVVADTFWRLPSVLRSDSPHSFAARGPHAEHITAPHPPEVPHGADSPIGKAYELDAQVLLLGVDHDANTTVHLAELFAGVRYRIAKLCTVLIGGVEARVDYDEIDHCCRGFALVGDWLAARGLERRGDVGHAASRLAPARDVVTTVVEELEPNRMRFLCDHGSGCDQCNLARRGVPRS